MGLLWLRTASTVYAEHSVPAVAVEARRLRRIARQHTGTPRLTLTGRRVAAAAPPGLAEQMPDVVAGGVDEREAVAVSPGSASRRRFPPNWV
jgi:hypothetical protein